MQRIFIVGGSGFVGNHLVARLTKDNSLQLRVFTRNPQANKRLLKYPGVELVTGDIFVPEQLQKMLQGCDAIINLVGILNEAGSKQSFKSLHVELVRAIVEAANLVGIKRYLHMSALHANAESGPSQYLYSKGEGEKIAHSYDTMDVTSFRASVIFGPGDSFFNRFAGLLRFAPGFFPLACAQSRFQPVYVGDVVEAFAVSINNPDTYDKRYNLCGPEVFSLQDLVAYTASLLGKNIKIIALNDIMARLQGHVMGNIPGKPFSYDNYLSLQVDSICTANSLAELGIEPKSVQSIVPSYVTAKK